MELAKRLPVILVAVAVMALGAASSTTAQQTGGSAFSPKQSVSNARATAVLRRAERVMENPAGRDVTIALSELVAAIPRLSQPEVNRANALLARPTDGGNDPQKGGYTVKEAAPFCSSHFCVHYVRTTNDAPDLTDANGNGFPDYAELISVLAELSYRTEVGRLNWTVPRKDKKIGGSNRTDIYLAQIGNEGLFGYAAIDPGQATRNKPFKRSLYSYLVVDDNFSRKEFRAAPLDSASVTIAHEFNHVLQFTYDVLQDSWMKESSATWMENRVFTESDDYLRYLKGWARQTRVPLTKASFPKLYGSAVWNQWLGARYGPDIIRGAWERAVNTRPGGFSVDAYGSAIRRAGRSTFERDFTRFAADTAEWNVNRRFPEGRQFPRVKRSGKLRPGGRITRRINHTAYQLIDVDVPKRARSLRLGAFVDRGTRAAIALVGRVGKGRRNRIITRLRCLRSGGSRSIALGFPGRFRELTAVLVNTDATQNGFSGLQGDWRYTRDRVLFKASLKIR